MHKKYYIIAIFLVVFIILGMYIYNSKNESVWDWDENIIVGEKKEANPKNGSYVIEDSEVALNNGYNETEIEPGSSSKIITRYFGNEAKGDFNKDNIEDKAFLLTQEGGGTGIFYYLASLVSSKNDFIGTNTIFIGDRISPQSSSFENGLIVINYADRKPDEPFSAKPSVGVSRYFEIRDNNLKKIKKDVVQNQILCSPESKNADVCTMEMNPVCAQVEIQCIKAPCYPVKQTFNNACEACKNSLVKSYDVGACKNTQ